MKVGVLLLGTIVCATTLSVSAKGGKRKKDERDSISTGVIDCGAQLVGCATQLEQMRSNCPEVATVEFIEDLLIAIQLYFDSDMENKGSRKLFLSTVFNFFRRQGDSVNDNCNELLNHCDGIVKSFDCPKYSLPKLFTPPPTEPPRSNETSRAPVPAATTQTVPVPTTKPVVSQTSPAIRTEQELRNAIMAASTDVSSQSPIFLGTPSILLEASIDMGSKSFELLCGMPPCTITGNGKTALFTGSPSNAQFNGIEFTNGMSAEGGGAFHIQSGNVTFVNCEFSGNKAQRGGAIYMNGMSYVTVISSTFQSNSAERNGGVIYLADGTLYVLESQFSHNVAVSNGGAIYMLDGAMDIASSTIFNANTAGFSGGAVFVDSATATIQESTFLGNVAYFTGDGGGGAIAGYLAKLTIESVIFKGNSAVEGSDILVEDDLDPTSFGSMIHCKSSIFCDGLKNAVSELGDGLNANTNCQSDGITGRDAEGKC